MFVLAMLGSYAVVEGAPPPPPPPSFGFSSVLGDWMVLQQNPAAAAVYGPVSAGATGVTVTVSDGKTSYDVVAKVGKYATHQPYGYVDTKTGAQLPVVAETWKAVLHPTAAGGDYTITAKCTGCTNATTAKLAHVTFGDMWYCSGQSNMWLPVQYSFTRNETVAAIAAGKYTNIRGMFSPSATTPTAGKWKTSLQAIQDGNQTHPTYSLFDMVTPNRGGGAC
jgi:sialate O-acetylesterase